MLQNPFISLGDDAIHQGLLGLAKLERDTGADIILHLLVVKERKLYAAWGHDSVFTYCTERLGFSRSTAYRRKVVMEKVNDFPALLARLNDGSIQLCAAAAVAPHLTDQNAEEMLDAVAKLSHREVEVFLVKQRAVTLKANEEPAGLRLDFTTPALPQIATEGENAALTPKSTGPVIPQLPLPRTIIKPLTEHASRVNMTLTEPTLALLIRAKELLAGKSDDEIHRLALDSLLDRIAPERRHARREKRREKLAAKNLHPETPPGTPQSPSPSGGSRRGKLADRDAAKVNGGGQCTFLGPDGHRCTARAFIETDHVIPVSKGGPSQLWNFAPLCRIHNAFKGAKLPRVLPNPTASFWS